MRCKAIKSDGERCLVEFGLDDDELCWHHSPKRADERRRAMRQGGNTTAAQRRKFSQKTITQAEALSPPETAADAVKWASWVTWATACGVLDKGTAREVSYSLRTLLNSLDRAETEEAIAELQAQVRQLQGKPKLGIG